MRFFKRVMYFSSGDPLMLCKPQHFRYSFLHALAYDAHYLSDLFIAVVEAAVKLEEFDDLYAKFRDLDFDLGLSHEKQHQLGIVLEYVLGRDSTELVQNGISLQDIRSFVNDASRKLGEVESSPAETKRARVRRVLTAKPVSTWRLDFDVLAGRAEAPLEPSPEPSPEPSRAPTPAPTSAVASFPSNSGNTAAEASPAPSTHVPAEEAAVGTGAAESEVEVPLDSIYPDTSSAAHTYSKTVDETTSDANNDTTGTSRLAAAAADTGDSGMYQKEEQPVEQYDQYAKYNKYDKYEKYERIDLSTDSAEVEAVTETETEKHAEASSPFSSVTTSADADVEAEASPFSPTERQEEHAGVSTFAPEAAVAAQREEASATADSTAAMEDSAESSKQEEETALAGTDADVDAAGDNKEVTLETAATEAAASSSIDALVETDVEVAVEVEGETAEAELFVDASAPPCEEVAAAEVETKA